MPGGVRPQIFGTCRFLTFTMTRYGYLGEKDEEGSQAIWGGKHRQHRLVSDALRLPFGQVGRCLHY